MTVLHTDFTVFIKHAARGHMSINCEILLILHVKYKEKIWILLNIKDVSGKRELPSVQQPLPFFVIKQV